MGWKKETQDKKTNLKMFSDPKMQSIVGVERASYMWYPQSQLHEGRVFAIFEEASFPERTK